jgi:hypothetical protein
MVVELVSSFTTGMGIFELAAPRISEYNCVLAMAGGNPNFNSTQLS